MAYGYFGTIHTYGTLQYCRSIRYNIDYSYNSQSSDLYHYVVR